MREDINTRKCYKCKNIKPFMDFYKDRTRKFGIGSLCISCKKQYQLDNKDKRRQKYLDNREELSKQQRKKEKRNQKYDWDIKRIHYK